MKSCKNKLMLGGIITIIIGLMAKNISAIYSILMVIIGTILVSWSDNSYEKLKSKKTVLIIMAIMLIYLNIVTSIFLFLVLSSLEKFERQQINAPPINQETNNTNIPNIQNQQIVMPTKIEKKKENISPEVKKIDLLLKLGVTMVFISGILFATTSWEFITNPIKAIALIILGILFLGLSNFSEKKLKLEKTTFMYWILSMSFFLLTWVGIGYFGLINKWFTYSGEGYNLVYMITFLLISILAYMTNMKFPKKEIPYIIYTGILLSIYNLIAFFDIAFLIRIIIINVLLFIPLLFSNKETSLYNFSKVIIYMLFLPILFSVNTSSNLLAIPTITLNIITLLYLIHKNENEDENKLVLVINYILIVFGLFSLDIKSFQSVFIMILTSIETVLIRLSITTKKKKLNIDNQILYSISSLMLYFNSTSQVIELLIISLIYLLVTTICDNNLHNDELEQPFYYLQPVALLFTILSVASYIDESFFAVNLGIVSLILVIVYGLLTKTTEEVKLKKEYFIFLIGIGIISTLLNLGLKNIILCIITPLTMAYTCYHNYENYNENKTLTITLYIFLLISIIISIVSCEIITKSIILNNIIVLIIYGLLLYFIKHEDYFTKTNHFALVIPMYNIVENCNIDYNIQSVLFNILQLYILYLIVKFICKLPETKKMIGTAGLIVILLQVFFINDLIVGIYIGIIGIIITMIGFYKNEYNSFFLTGIIIVIVNIIYQLKDLWSKIPFWLYLLVCGLSIIGFVTYKEMKKMKK